jgi:hypothetical protein
LRKELGRGRIREAIDVPRERFEARIESRCRALVARLTGTSRERLRVSV